MELFKSNKKWDPVAIRMLQVFLQLLLQKPPIKSKLRDHVK